MGKLKIIKEITKSLNPINNIYKEINHGGCGVYAHALSSILQQYGINSNIISIGIHYSKPTHDINNVINESLVNYGEINMHNLSLVGCKIFHLMVEVEIDNRFYFIDSTGVYEDISRNPIWNGIDTTILSIDGRMNIKECYGLSNNPEGWNHLFNRSNIPGIYDYIKSRLNMFFENNNPVQLELSF